MDENSLQRSRRRRLRLFLIVTLLAGAKLAWSLFDIQVLRHESFEARAQSQQKRRIAVPARRGAIYDRHGLPLAVNRDRNAVYLVPNHVRDPQAFVDSLAAILPVSREEIRARLARGGFYVPLLRSVDLATARRLEAADLPGVGIETASLRAYPHGRLAAAVIGQVDVDNHGIGGLELQYDPVLRGVDGWTVHQRDAMGREYPNFALPMAQPVNGSDVYLTLDVGLQEIAEEALDEGLAETRAATGSLVIVDPRTGEILAMANRPDGDPNAIRTPLKNYAVVDMYEPGSTFKLVTLSGLYENRLARPDEQIFCENGSYVFARRSKPVRDVHPYGLLSVVDVIGKSSNICTVKLAQRLGNERMFEFARRFGFGLPTGVDFPGEARGVLRLPREWSALSPYSIAMGYEVSASPLQLAMMFAAVANGGELLQPYLVGRVTGPRGEVLRRSGPRRVRRVMSPETARMVTDALVQVVNEGTGTAADLDLLQVAGKSGTAYKTRPGGGYALDRYNASFGGFFPADNPRFVVFVRLDDPRGEHYGGRVAGPIFKRAIETTLLAERVPVDSSFLARIRQPHQVVRQTAPTVGEPAEVAYGPAPELSAAGRAGPPGVRVVSSLVPSAPGGAAAKAVPGAAETAGGAGQETQPSAVGRAAGGGTREGDGPTAEPVVPLGCPGCQGAVPPAGQVRVPDFTAMSLREALVVASQRRLQLRFSGAGEVVRQDPAPGEIVPAGSSVRVDNARSARLVSAGAR